MKILCPNCQKSIPLTEGNSKLTCPKCGIEANVSSMGTAPGVAPVPIVKDFTGHTLGGYLITELIGMGGMGVVYKGIHPNTQQTIAIKILNNDFQWKQSEFIERFKREVAVLKRLKHPNILILLDSGCQDGQHYLVTEFVEGETLAQRLRKGPIEMDESIRIMTEICNAITYAHKNGVVHRDIKPANIILADESVKVLDFGLAQITGADSQITTLTRTDLAMGTFNYLSPEQRTNAKSVDGRADIFSMGVVFYEMLTGNLPLGNFDLPSKVIPSAGKRVDRVIQKSLHSSPDLRYSNAQLLVNEIQKIPQKNKYFSLTTKLAAVACMLLFGSGAGYVWFIQSSPIPKQIEHNDNYNMSGVSQLPPSPIDSPEAIHNRTIKNVMRLVGEKNGPQNIIDTQTSKDNQQLKLPQTPETDIPTEEIATENDDFTQRTVTKTKTAKPSRRSNKTATISKEKSGKKPLDVLERAPLSASQHDKRQNQSDVLNDKTGKSKQILPNEIEQQLTDVPNTQNKKAPPQKATPSKKSKRSKKSSMNVDEFMF